MECDDLTPAILQLREPRHQRGAKAEPHKLIGNVLRITKTAEEQKQRAHAQQGKRDDHKAGDGATAERGLQGLVERCSRRRRGANVGADGYVHAREAGQTGADRAHQEADDGFAGDGLRARRHVVAQENNHGQDHGQDSDRPVLPGEERFSAFADGVGDGLHLGGSGVGGQHHAGKCPGGDECKDPYCKRDP